MIALSTTIAAAAYLLLGQPGHTGQPAQVQPPPCELTMSMDPRPPPPHGNHLSVRWNGGHHHHHHARRHHP